MTTYLALLLFLFPMAYSPGPGNLIFAATGARFGFGATLMASAGYHLATWWVSLGIGVGLARASGHLQHGFDVLKTLGALYILWMAWRFMRASTPSGAGQARALRFGDGVLLLLFNPKAYVIMVLMFSQFPLLPGLSPLTSAILITTIFTVNNLVAFSLWSLVGDQMARWFQHPVGARRLNHVFAAVLAGCAVWILFS